MEAFINKGAVAYSMGKVLIATMFSADAVLVAAHQVSPDRMFLFIDEKPNKERDKNLKLIQESLGRVIEIKIVKVKVYDIVQIATKAVELVDAQPNNEDIFVNITSGRKTLAIGLLMAAYVRPDRVKKIGYNPEEDKKSVVFLPKLSFNLNKSQHKIIDHLAKADSKSITELADELDISRAMLYKTIQELKEMDLVDTEKGIILTDAGRIARL